MKRVRPGDSKTAVAYLRVSTDDQKLGPEAQRASIEAWAAREGVSIVAWHVDQGVSGGTEMRVRPGLTAALGELRASKAGVLVVAKRDRIARDVVVAAMIERAVSTCGAKVTTADGVGNGDSPADSFMRSILDAAAAYERALIRARTKAALGALKARGQRAGAVPYGYSADESGRLSRNDDEQAIITEVSKLRGEGLSFRRVVAELQSRGFVGRTGRPLALNQVVRIVAKRAA